MRDINIGIIEHDRFVSATTVNHARYEAEITPDGTAVSFTSAICYSYYRADDIDDLIRMLIRTKEFMKTVEASYSPPTAEEDY